MSRRAIKAINWSAMAERVPEHQKNAFSAFRTKSDQYLRRMIANPEVSPQIDWGYYQKNVTTPGLVDKFKKEYESLNIPYPQDKYTSLIDAEEKETIAKIEKYRAECESTIEGCVASIASLKAIMPYDQMTMEEFIEYHPECMKGTVENPSIWPHTEELRLAVEEGLKEEAEGHHH